MKAQLPGRGCKIGRGGCGRANAGTTQSQKAQTMMLRADAAWLVLPPGHGCCNLASSVRILTGKQPSVVISGKVGPQHSTIVVQKPDCDEVAPSDTSLPHFETLNISMQTYARFCRTHFTSVREVIIKAMLETTTMGWWVAKSKPNSNNRHIQRKSRHCCWKLVQQMKHRYQ